MFDTEIIARRITPCYVRVVYMQIVCKEAALADRPLMRGCSKSPENGGVRVLPYKTELRKAGGIYSKQERFIDSTFFQPDQFRVYRRCVLGE